MPTVPATTLRSTAARANCPADLVQPASGRRSVTVRILRCSSQALVFACFMLGGSAAIAAGKSDMTSEGPGMRSAERADRLQEMRRQLLEHQRSRRGGVMTDRTPALSSGSAVPSLRDLPAGDVTTGVSAATATPLDATPLDAMPMDALPMDALPVGTMPMGTMPLGTIRSGAGSPGTSPLGGPLGTTPITKRIATPATAPPVSDSRLSDRERNLLRHQLRQLPRLGSPPGN